MIKKFEVKKLILPLNQPFRTALGQHDSLENVLFSLTLSDGTKGYGEAAIATHITGETIPQTIVNLNKIGNQLIGKDPCDYWAISAFLHQQLPHNKAALAAIEMALLDALTRSMKIPLWKFFGTEAITFKTDITIVISELAETEDSVKKFYKQGFRAFKVKIGKDMDLDLKRVLAVHTIAKRSKIILDGNQGYTSDQALKFLKELKKYKIQPYLFEQPVPKNDWDGMKRLTRLGGVSICADESCQDLKDCLRIISEKAAHGINIKIMKSGLIQGRDIAYLAKSADLGLMIGGMMESSLAMTCSAHMAAGLGCFNFIDLDTPFFLKNGKNNPYLSSDGTYDLRHVKKGIGIKI
ncbi:MAG: dipeptide epimerase [Candidatus Omnitrophica bacterium]|nr:dipeptide epimerase [Candidatus Omnitrophota bacterium]